jgi:hypothetical protein
MRIQLVHQPVRKHMRIQLVHQPVRKHMPIHLVHQLVREHMRFPLVHQLVRSHAVVVGSVVTISRLVPARLMTSVVECLAVLGIALHSHMLWRMVATA